VLNQFNIFDDVLQCELLKLLYKGIRENCLSERILNEHLKFSDLDLRSYWHLDTLKCIIDKCIILYNIIVEDECATYNDNFDYSYDYLDDDPITLPNNYNIGFQHKECQNPN